MCVYRKDLVIGFYPGVIMTTALHDRFIKKYHCPTAVRCTSLDHPSETGDGITEYVIVGDPTAHGPIINDAKNTGKKGELKSTESDQQLPVVPIGAPSLIVCV